MRRIFLLLVTLLGLFTCYELVSMGVDYFLPPSYSFGQAVWFEDQIVFALARRTNKLESDLYILDSSHTRRLTHENLTMQSPTWAADGEHIALIVYYTISTGSEVFIIDPDGNNFQQITDDDLNKSQPAWSPDGTQIAYIATDFEDYTALWVTDLNNNTRELRDDLRYPYEFPPEWSPDGTQILLPGMVVDAQTGEIQFELPIWSKNNTWSPDGSQIGIFQAGDDNPDYEQGIYIYDVNSSILSPLPSRDRHVFDLSWSPDGQYFLYMTYRSDTDLLGRRLYLRRVDGQGERVLLTDQAHEYNSLAQWSPDGRQIAFGGRQGIGQMQP